jgi:hypothetical protein
MIIIIGRGHSGTRVISNLLYSNGYFTGELNKSFDMVPPSMMYSAVQYYGEQVQRMGKFRWKFPQGEPPQAFKQLVKLYLKPIIKSDKEKYFKLPETTLCYPWIVKMFPNAHYIHWIRNPNSFGKHLSDNFSRWNIPVSDNSISYYTEIGIKEERIKAAISCKYQWDIVESIVKPKRFIRIRYEDFCLNQNLEIKKLENFLNKSLTSVEVKTDSVYKWRNDPNHFNFPFLKEMIDGGGYNDRL